MRLVVVGGGWVGASRSVRCALAVVGPKATACLPLVAMPSTATSQTGPLASVLLPPRPAIALVAPISKNYSNSLSLSLITII